MNYGDALDALKDGKHLARTGWPEGQFLYLPEGSALGIPEGLVNPPPQEIFVQLPSGENGPWHCWDKTDEPATDWLVIDG